jgi:hypothetical protein
VTAEPCRQRQTSLRSEMSLRRDISPRRTRPPTGTADALAAAVRRTNAAFYALPEPFRPNLNGERWRQLEDELDQARASGDVAAARMAITCWEGDVQRELRGNIPGNNSEGAES